MNHNKKCPQYLIASVKDASAKGIVTGYLSSFGYLDADNEIVMAGAFTKSIQEMGPASSHPRIKYLLDHNREKALGTFTVLKEDATGLYYEAQVGTHDLGRDFLKMVESGLITEHSIGYQVVKKTIINPESDWQDQQVQLHELKLMEGSALQCWGANPNTPMTGMKGMKYAENRLPNIISALKNGTFTDKTFDLLEKELIFLQHIISDYETTEPERKDEATQPNDEDLNVLILANANMKMRLSSLTN